MLTSDAGMLSAASSVSTANKEAFYIIQTAKLRIRLSLRVAAFRALNFNKSENECARRKEVEQSRLTEKLQKATILSVPYSIYTLQQILFYNRPVP